MLCLLLLASGFAFGWFGFDRDPAEASVSQVQTLAAPPKPVRPPDPVAPPVAQVLRSGVLIVVSKQSQRMFVFKDGALWKDSPVSTGRRGHATPAGVFPILQKQVFHRSNLYSNAPMPFMQRLTWSGIALHAGRLPGYAASHGCIRLPPDVAKALYGLTRPSATTVVVTNVALKSEAAARALALSTPAPRPAAVPQPPVVTEPQPGAVPALPPATMPPPAAPPPPAPLPSGAPPPRIEPLAVEVLPMPAGQTVQFAAAGSPAEAEAHWARLVASHPELRRMQKVVVPATVGGRQYYRLRASAPDAQAQCAALKGKGVACFKVS